MGERGGGLYIETAEDEGRRGGWESVLNTCFSYRVHFEAWSASFSLTSSPRLLLVAETQAASRVHTHIHTRTYTHTRARSPWFISLLNNSLLFSRPPLLGPQLPFDLSTPPPATSIHFYLRADALYPVLPFFFFFLFSSFSTLLWPSSSRNHYRRIEWRDTCSYLLGSSQRKNSSFYESTSIVSFFLFFFSYSNINRGNRSLSMRKFDNYFYYECYCVFQLIEALEKF